MNLILSIVATTLLVIRAVSRKSLSPKGIVFAILTAIVHSLHPWNLPFVLLISFYGLGTTATKVKHVVKAKLTISSSGAPGGESARNHIQVLANSVVASVLVLLHCYQLGVISTEGFRQQDVCFSNDILVVGIIANYAATLADTLSSELGILSRTPPRLITTLRPTLPGTNGGVTSFGIFAGGAGAAIIGLISVMLLPYCQPSVDGYGIHLPKGEAHVSFGNSGIIGTNWGIKDKALFVGFITIVGVAGSLLDSLLGAVFQESVVDVRLNKIVEGPNGSTVLVEPSSTHLSTCARIHSYLGQSPQSAAATIPATAVTQETPRHRQAVAAEKDANHKHGHDDHEHKPSRVVISGSRWGVLDNNQVNLSMAVTASIGAMIWWRLAGLAGCDSC